MSGIVRIKNDYIKQLEEIIKQINNGKCYDEITIKFPSKFKFYPIEKIIFMRLLESLGQSKIKITLIAASRAFFEELNIPFYSSLEYSNIYLQYREFDFNYNLSISDWNKEQEQIDKFIERVKNSSLTTFEKYVATYNFVKKFKSYKDIPKSQSVKKLSARDISSIIKDNNPYIVCAGFANLFSTLLNKLQISNMIIDCQVISANCAPHNRVLVYLCDPKYGLNDYYVADPTWDNKTDTLTYLMNNFEETKKQRNTK